MTSKGIMRRARLLYVVTSLLFVVPRVFAQEPTSDEGDDLDVAGEDIDMQGTLHMLEPPEIPERLSPGQRAQFAEILEFLHIRLRNVLAAGHSEEDATKVAIHLQQWQALLDLQSRLAEYLRNIGNP